MDITTGRRGPSVSVAVTRTAAIAVSIAVVGVPTLAFSGVGGLRGGWAVTALLGGVTGGVTGWFAWGRRGREAAAAVLAVIGVVVGLGIAHASIWSHGRLRASFDSIGAPPFFMRLTDVDGGNGLCFDECSSVTRVWLVPAPPTEAKAAITPLLRAKGFSLGPWVADPRWGEQAEARRGHLRVYVGVRTDWATADASMRRVPVPAGYTAVTLTLSQ